jgi:hypothetical protein
MSQPLVLKTDYGDQLTIEVLGRMHPGSRDFWDGNWMVSPITLRIGGFAGRIEAGLRMDELVGLRVGLEKLLNGQGRRPNWRVWSLGCACGCRSNATWA